MNNSLPISTITSHKMSIKPSLLREYSQDEWEAYGTVRNFVQTPASPDIAELQLVVDEANLKKILGDKFIEYWAQTDRYHMAKWLFDWILTALVPLTSKQRDTLKIRFDVITKLLFTPGEQDLYAAFANGITELKPLLMKEINKEAHGQMETALINILNLWDR